MLCVHVDLLTVFLVCCVLCVVCVYRYFPLCIHFDVHTIMCCVFYNTHRFMRQDIFIFLNCFFFCPIACLCVSVIMLVFLLLHLSFSISVCLSFCCIHIRVYTSLSLSLSLSHCIIYALSLVLYIFFFNSVLNIYLLTRHVIYIIFDSLIIIIIIIHLFPFLNHL